MRTYTVKEQEAIAYAASIIESKVIASESLTSCGQVMEFLKLKNAALEHEVFSVMFLNTQHKLIAFENMFTGSIKSASVYPREIAKRALALNAAALILVHNHPSGNATPSEADELITAKITKAMTLLDIDVLDHVITGGGDAVSFATLGLV